DDVEQAECRRATGYVVGGAVFFGGALCQALLSHWTDRADDLALGACSFSIPIGLAATLPSGTSRNLAILGLAALAATSLFARDPSAAGSVARFSFFLGFCVATPALIFLHARARTRSRRARSQAPGTES